MSAETGPKSTRDIAEKKHVEAVARGLQVGLLRAFDNIFWTEEETVEFSSDELKGRDKRSVGIDSMGRTVLAHTKIISGHLIDVDISIMLPDETTVESAGVFRSIGSTYGYQETDVKTLKGRHWRPIVGLLISNDAGTAREIRRVIRELKNGPVPPVIPL